MSAVIALLCVLLLYGAAFAAGAEETSREPAGSGVHGRGQPSNEVRAATGDTAGERTTSGAPGRDDGGSASGTAAAGTGAAGAGAAGTAGNGSSTDGKLSSTRRSIKIGDQVIDYRATAGYLPIVDADGKHKADIFFTAYVKETDASASAQRQGRGEVRDASRPVSFAFNGGPGAASVWLHLGALGPRMAAVEGNDRLLPPPYELTDNPFSWLAFTDLVFIDPVGTGYSRPASGEDAKQFYSVKNDIESVGEFIRLYCTRFNRWPSPKFLVGESYGTTRAAALASHLQDRHHILLTGVVLVSPVLDFQTILFTEGNDLVYFIYLPAYTATAWYHKKLPPDLQADLEKALSEAEQWALSDYLTALAAGSALSPEVRKTVVEKLSRLTGISAATVDKANLRIDQVLFARELLAGERKIVGRLDSRFTYDNSNPTNCGSTYDPILFTTAGIYGTVMRDYVRRDLGFETDIPYEALNDKVVGNWDWHSGMGGRQGYVYVTDNLREAMMENPNLHVLMAGGYFDLGTPYYAARYSANHLGLPPSLRGNLTLAFYEAGHQMYTHKPSHEKLFKDAAAFYGHAVSMRE